MEYRMLNNKGTAGLLFHLYKKTHKLLNMQCQITAKNCFSMLCTWQAHI